MTSVRKNPPQDLNLDLLSYQDQLKLTVVDGKQKIWDPIRKKWYVLTPEEHVRQLLIQYLLKSDVVSKNLISIEKQIKVNQVMKRFDICIHDSQGAPQLLIECKAPRIKINQDVFDQVSYYNVTLQVPYLLVTNGLVAYLCHIDHEHRRFHFLDEFKF